MFFFAFQTCFSRAHKAHVCFVTLQLHFLLKMTKRAWKNTSQLQYRLKESLFEYWSRKSPIKYALQKMSKESVRIVEMRLFKSIGSGEGG